MSLTENQRALLEYSKEFRYLTSEQRQNLHSNLSHRLSHNTMLVFFRYIKKRMFEKIRKGDLGKYVMFPNCIFWLDAAKLYLFWFCYNESYEKLKKNFGSSTKTWMKLIHKMNKYWIEEDWLKQFLASNLEERMQYAQEANLSDLIDGVHFAFTGTRILGNSEDDKKYHSFKLCALSVTMLVDIRGKIIWTSDVYPAATPDITIAKRGAERLCQEVGAIASESEGDILEFVMIFTRLNRILYPTNIFKWVSTSFKEIVRLALEVEEDFLPETHERSILPRLEELVRTERCIC